MDKSGLEYFLKKSWRISACHGNDTPNSECLSIDKMYRWDLYEHESGVIAEWKSKLEDCKKTISNMMYILDHTIISPSITSLIEENHNISLKIVEQLKSLMSLEKHSTILEMKVELKVPFNLNKSQIYLFRKAAYQHHNEKKSLPSLRIPGNSALLSKIRQDIFDTENIAIRRISYLKQQFDLKVKCELKNNRLKIAEGFLDVEIRKMKLLRAEQDESLPITAVNMYLSFLGRPTGLNFRMWQEEEENMKKYVRESLSTSLALGSEIPQGGPTTERDVGIEYTINGEVYRVLKMDIPKGQSYYLLRQEKEDKYRPILQGQPYSLMHQEGGERDKIQMKLISKAIKEMLKNKRKNVFV